MRSRYRSRRRRRSAGLRIGGRSAVAPGTHVEDVLQLNSEQQFQLIADRLSKISDPTLRAALAEREAQRKQQREQAQAVDEATLAGIEWAGRGMSVFSQVRIAYRTPTQLGLLERFHETLKYEEVYWHLYDDPADARQKLAATTSVTT